MKKISLLYCLMLSIYVNTSLLAQTYQVTVRNDLYGDDGGVVGVAVSPNTPVSYPSPKIFSGGKDDHVIVKAYENQNVNGKVWFFNDTEYANEQSEWRWINESAHINRHLTYNATYTDPLPMSELDQGDEYVAFLKTTNYTTSGTMSSDEIWFTPVTLSGNVTVANGVTLTISGATVNLNGYYIKCEGTGKIINSGTVQPDINVKSGSDNKGQYPSIQSALSNATSGQDIYLASGTYNNGSYVYMKSGVDVIGESRDNTIIEDPITFNSVGNATLRDVHAKQRITVNYGYSISIYKVKSSHTDQFGVDAKGSSPDIDRFYSNISPHYGYAVYGHNSAYPEIWSSYLTNKIYAIYVTGYSDAEVYDTYFCQQNDYDIYASVGGYVDASDEDNTFSGDPADYTYGDVDYPEDWQDCGLSKGLPSEPVASAPATPASTEEVDDPGLNDYREAVKSYHSIRAVLRQDFEDGKSTKASDYESDYNNTINQFKEVMDKYPDTPSCIRAMGRVTNCYWELGRPESVAEYIRSLLKDSRYEKSRPYAENLLIPYHLHNKEYQTALDLSDKIMEEIGKGQLACEVLYGKGIIYKYYVKDEKAAEEMFKQVIEEYPNNPTALSAKAELGETGGGEYFASDSTAVTESSGFKVQNYPNPFNPETTIRYSLPAAGRVMLKIYDLRGREVVTLLNADQPAGTHTLTWNSRDRLGREAASGVYFYRLEFAGHVKSGKMVLMR